MPKFTSPSFHANAMFLIAPVAIILVAENLGHIKAIGAMTGRSLDAYLGRAFLGDSLATIVSAFGGGTGVTTYAENIGVMAATRVYSTVLFVIAAIVAIFLGFSPKFGALILSIPGPVIGGLSIVLFGLIAAMAGRIWVENRVDFANPKTREIDCSSAIVGLTESISNLLISMKRDDVGRSCDARGYSNFRDCGQSSKASKTVTSAAAYKEAQAGPDRRRFRR